MRDQRRGAPQQPAVRAVEPLEMDLFGLHGLQVAEAAGHRPVPRLIRPTVGVIGAILAPLLHIPGSGASSPDAVRGSRAQDQRALRIGDEHAVRTLLEYGLEQSPLVLDQDAEPLYLLAQPVGVVVRGRRHRGLRRGQGHRDHRGGLEAGERAVDLFDHRSNQPLVLEARRRSGDQATSLPERFGKGFCCVRLLGHADPAQSSPRSDRPGVLNGELRLHLPIWNQR
jgi:hypothetical protein